jgi:YfiH family protein
MDMGTLINQVFKGKNIVVGFTTRWGGASEVPFDNFNLALHVDDDVKAVLRNRNLLAKELEMKSKNIAWMNQVHSDNIQIVVYGGETLQTDGIITNRQGLVLLVLVADCIPILFYDPEREVVAAVHAGREGCFQNISGRMIQRFKKEFGSSPENIKVFLGPSIQKECYEVNENMIKKFKDGWGEEYIYASKNLDLPLLNKNQLLQEGVLAENIKLSKICNHCDKNYFSYRRHQKTGRFAGIIFLR